MTSDQTNDIQGELIQVCTDIYYDCKTIKELDRLTDKALALLEAARTEAYKKGYYQGVKDEVECKTNYPDEHEEQK